MANLSQLYILCHVLSYYMKSKNVPSKFYIDVICIIQLESVNPDMVYQTNPSSDTLLPVTD